VREDPDEEVSSRDVEMSWSVETHCPPNCSVNLGRSIPTKSSPPGATGRHPVVTDDVLLTVSVLEAGATQIRTGAVFDIEALLTAVGFCPEK
jgi:hypothetical protein